MLGLILAAVGTLGVGGFIALAIFAPPLAASVAKGLLDIVSRLWATRIGMALMVGTACLIGGYLYGERRGVARVRAEWDAAEKRAIKIGTEVREQAEKEIPPDTSDEPQSAPAPEPSRHIPFFTFKKDHNDACPPTPACPAAPRRPVDRVLRNDPFNRDNH